MECLNLKNEIRKVNEVASVILFAIDKDIEQPQVQKMGACETQVVLFVRMNPFYSHQCLVTVQIRPPMSGVDVPSQRGRTGLVPGSSNAVSTNRRTIPTTIFGRMYFGFIWMSVEDDIGFKAKSKYDEGKLYLNLCDYLCL